MKGRRLPIIKATYVLISHHTSVTREQRYHETDARDRRRNDDLTEEYRRITKQYNDMQAKFRHFEIADNKRYEQVSTMPSQAPHMS